jgi:hypothetical protein
VEHSLLLWELVVSRMRWLFCGRISGVLAVIVLLPRRIIWLGCLERFFLLLSRRSTF